MPFIGTQPEVGGYSVLDALTASATASYTLQLNSANFIPNTANQLLVSLNGVIQKPGSSFTVSGSTLTFSSALTSSDSIDFIIAMGEPLLIGTPSDGTVTSSKLDTNIAIAGDLTVDTNVLKVDSTTNKVGINVTSPDAMLQVQNGDITVGWADNFIGAQFQTGSDFRLGMKFGTVGRTTKIVAETNDNNGEITFETNGSERARISNAGLHLGGTGAANALDDYEEGTWTPTLRGESGTEPAQNTATARYVKVGSLVHIEARVAMGADNGGSGMEMIGLPFASQNAVLFHMSETAAFGVIGVFFSNGSVAAGSGIVTFRQGGDGSGAWKSGTYVQTANGQYTVVGTYTTAS